MSDFDRNYATLRGVGTDRAVAYDQGLRAHMIRVYNYMSGGVALTGVVAWLTYQMAVVTNAVGAIVGYTPFGQVTSGLNILQAVGKRGFGPPLNPEGGGAPKDKVQIESVTISTA